MASSTGNIYERELKHVLSGDKKAISQMIKTCSEEESKAYSLMLNDPFLVVRAAGSLGVDLVALRWDFSFPIEVKSSAEETMHFSRNPRLAEQADKMKRSCFRSSLLPIYAFRLKGVRGDPWRIFTMPSDEEIKGRNENLRRVLPKMEVTGKGNYIMRWNEGMKLCDLLTFMSIDPEEPVLFEE
ncbi:MAG: Holliday junction resolvase [Methanomassiliicoccaceae archaeon]|nr:Holliday junction resolvase [Methanomassiliicoccaceae archaeon]